MLYGKSHEDRTRDLWNESEPTEGRKVPIVAPEGAFYDACVVCVGIFLYLSNRWSSTMSKVICILESNGPEYRVHRLPNEDELEYHASPRGSCNAYAVWSYFTDAPTFDCMHKAIKEAEYQAVRRTEIGLARIPIVWKNIRGEFPKDKPTGVTVSI